MGIVVVGVGELNTSNSLQDTIKTYALGSCVGVIITAPRLKAAGLLHVALPDSNINLGMAYQHPGMFADTGIPFLLREMAKYGCGRNDFIIKLAGGASILDTSQFFEVGKRNLLAVKKILWKYKLGAISEDVGKEISRTVTINVESGKVILSSPGRGDWQI